MAEDSSTRIDRFYSTVQAFYRGEMQRANLWRQRLDTTTNWAVIITAGVLTWAFSSPSHPHIVIILSSLLLIIFSIIEARRYRFFDVWRSRVRVLEENFFAPAINAEHDAKDSGWSEIVAEDLEDPHFKISFTEAWGRRLKRTYLWILTALLLAWVIKVAIHPETATSIAAFTRSAGSTGIPGYLIITGIGLLYSALAGLALFSHMNDRHAKGAMSEDTADQDWKKI